MRTLLAVDEDSLFEDVLSSLRWCVRVGPDHEVTVLHATPVVAWMRRVAESSTTWAEYAREGDARAERLLAHCADLLSSWGIEAQTLTGEGHSAGEILRVARERAADLIVLGTRAHEESGFLVGSVSQKIKVLAETDVLLVRRGAPFGDSSFRAVLAVDGSGESLAAVESFARKTQTEEADVVLLHAVDLPRVSWGLDSDGDATDLAATSSCWGRGGSRACGGCRWAALPSGS